MTMPLCHKLTPLWQFIRYRLIFFTEDRPHGRTVLVRDIPPAFWDKAALTERVSAVFKGEVFDVQVVIQAEKLHDFLAARDVVK